MDELKKYYKELDEILISREPKKLVEWVIKNGEEPVSEEVAEIAMHKLTLTRPLPQNLRLKSMFWLLNRGYDLTI